MLESGSDASAKTVHVFERTAAYGSPFQRVVVCLIHPHRKMLEQGETGTQAPRPPRARKQQASRPDRSHIEALCHVETVRYQN